MCYDALSKCHPKIERGKVWCRECGSIENVDDRLRSELRSVADRGKRGVKRRLARISRKANRFQTDTNHCISKKIVESLPAGSTIVLEDLTGIRDNSRLRKKQRLDFHR